MTVTHGLYTIFELMTESGLATLGGPGGPGGHAPPLFCVAKRKRGSKGKQERLSKQKPLKGCH